MLRDSKTKESSSNGKIGTDSKITELYDSLKTENYLNIQTSVDVAFIYSVFIVIAAVITRLIDERIVDIRWRQHPNKWRKKENEK